MKLHCQLALAVTLAALTFSIHAQSLTPLRDFGLKYDFFLAHAMKKTKFNSRWRIHYPSDLDLVVARD